MDEITTIRKVVRAGNSLAVTIPAADIKKLKLKKGDRVQITVTKQADAPLDDDFQAALIQATTQYANTLEKLRLADQK
ncbi:AbrB/MazE/SpoVT family DNA-binding domain-containing protein [Loigolactobacillus binensis]|uniref:AbrB/MazE/SpoVT family DNA-binding domain-containing protein n=1 Tax=Loigolactobacillus binensis TaxID=2559922 RepID=A0ABW3EA67_9LACO|nr:AbrB/MazE/SpoVT family DNA-binding domain-containing protein [Loigolactobacillus binensis]